MVSDQWSRPKKRLSGVHVSDALIRISTQVPDGFISHFYAISEHVSPVLAFGFLGPRQHLSEVCTIFKVRERRTEEPRTPFSIILRRRVTSLSNRLNQRRIPAFLNQLCLMHVDKSTFTAVATVELISTSVHWQSDRQSNNIGEWIWIHEFLKLHPGDPMSWSVRMKCLVIQKKKNLTQYIIKMN